MKRWYFNIPNQPSYLRSQHLSPQPGATMTQKKIMTVGIQYLALLSLQGIYSGVNYSGLKIPIDNLIPIYCLKDGDSPAINIQIHTNHCLHRWWKSGLWLQQGHAVILSLCKDRNTHSHSVVMVWKKSGHRWKLEYFGPLFHNHIIVPQYESNIIYR